MLSIIVPTFNQATLTIKCFDSIRQNTVAPYELIWVDNGSRDADLNPVFRIVERSNIQAKLVRFRTNTGFVTATNAGIREAQGEHIILLNNDTEVGYRWDEKLVKPLTDPAVGAVGPVTQSRIAWQEIGHVNARWQTKLPTFRGSTDVFSKILDQGFGDKYVEVEKTPLAFFCVALRREVFSEIGLLDERFGPGLADDDDFCFRLRQAGKKLILSLGTFVFHHHRVTFRATGVQIDSLLRMNTQKLKQKREQELRITSI